MVQKTRVINKSFLYQILKKQKVIFLVCYYSNKKLYKGFGIIYIYERYKRI